MNSIIISSITIFLLIITIGYLFFKLKHISWYSVSIYLFLASFWIIISIVRQSNSFGGEPTKPWVWPVVTSSFQFIQVLVRIPLGKFSQKIRSRQYPILIATTSILISAVSIVSSNFSLWSLIIATISTGIFGATFGLQNQYYSENFNIRAVFMTVALISMLPAMGALSSTIVIESVKLINIEQMRWTLLLFTCILILIMISFYIFKERKEVIKLDNVSEVNKVLESFSLKQVLTFAFAVVFISIGYNLVTTSSAQDQITEETDLEKTILTIISIFIALSVSLFLIRLFRSFTLSMVGQFLIVFGLAFGLIHIFVINQEWSKWLYLITITIGFAVYQNTLLGVALHFDHKNSLLVLGIWLTVRSFANGTGSLINGIAINYSNYENIKWLILGALILSLISIPYSVYYFNRRHHQIFSVVDNWEAKANRYIWR